MTADRRKNERVTFKIYLLSFLPEYLLFMMLLTSRDAGITCDEVLHYNHSVCVCDYFATHGKDQECPLLLRLQT